MPEISKEKALKQYGLSEKEIKVYLAALKLGSATVNEISKKAEIHRTTTYDILKALMEKGLASSVIKKKTKYFEVADPTKLINILEERKNKIKSVLPELNAIKGLITEKPKVEIYEGKAGLKTILDDIIKTKPNELLTISSSKIFNTLEFYFPHWINRRVKEKIPAKILQQKVKEIKEIKKKDKSKLREIRFLPEDFKINIHIQIYSNKVSILTLNKEQLIGIIIENKDIVETLRSFFESHWKQDKK